MNFIEDLKWRGALNQITDEKGLLEAMASGKIGAYVGTDPTADSLHLGHLIPFMVLKRFQNAGGKAVIIIGGATGAIGDPRPTTERQLLTQEQLAENEKGITAQVTKLFGDNDTRIVNNNDWLGKLTLTDFLRDYGKLFSINVMLKKDVVASRLETGISFTEFTYQVLQGIDFHELWRREDVKLQIGGSDQWGNITSGIDLIHSLEGNAAKAFGLTIPLMTDSTGKKFGKSEGNAIWLDPEKTSPYTFYQFWLNQNDADVVKYLKYFTFLNSEEIDALAKAIDTNPGAREAQRRLAQEVTKFVHGQAAVDDAEQLSKALFSGDVATLSAAQIADAFGGVPSFDITAESKNIIDFLVDGGVDQSKRQAREDVNNGAITINGEKVTDVATEISPSTHYDGKFVLVRRGKKKYFLGKVK
ncbi:tyrosine--tRNA ligase [Leuconostoc gelidum subsp. gelidum]|uniref:Tyrosine--tRNA ligase n=1 Tax=Leuconostoc gelidum subsp. gelidum TaxID=1607839 RepID=A0AB35FZJ7_LEUGE|nr:tyrosine--tRNA ligase [Leuconostoc gelidum]MBZ5965001.1 tyrosine--tRNA ligase [Leuconostoc gelidum subsp. gelidum]MBZ5974434.1 tyrosine--tRNA ligase [Leuconostoc gelidum subsp. gelidum]MBZ5977273.1 tyrosine--tRNA ligase [Leuconostoc gelidum subsp. gelidum]MBZ5986301.1 tyrosine--tRNA ligase [Leuconostoc gelidum subsp. gelidum]MBZ5998925.1 tyrosine--tRNA ligase [Leuconostoc gelidum subsp. gelidum]